METENQSEKIRQGFINEFTGAQDARSNLHAKFSEQGILIIEHRKKIMEVLITVSAGFLAVPKIFDINILNPLFYQIGFLILIILIVLILLHLKESIDEDEVRSIWLHNQLTSVLDRRIKELKEKYLTKNEFTEEDLSTYTQYRKAEDYSADMNKAQESNQNERNVVLKDKINYPSSFFIFLFMSGAFFTISSVLIPNIHIAYIVIIEIFFVLITSMNFASKIIGVYRNIISFFKN